MKIEAIYENGVFKPRTVPSDLEEGDLINITVEQPGLVARQRRRRLVIDRSVAKAIAKQSLFPTEGS